MSDEQAAAPELALDHRSGRVELTSAGHLFDVGRMYAISEAIEALQDDLKIHRLAGIGYAIAKLEALHAENRMRVMSQNFRLAAKHGAPLAQSDLVLNVGGGQPFIEWMPAEPEEA